MASRGSSARMKFMRLIHRMGLKIVDLSPDALQRRLEIQNVAKPPSNAFRRDSSTDSPLTDNDALQKMQNSLRRRKCRPMERWQAHSKCGKDSNRR